jgi:hypothetical protein
MLTVIATLSCSTHALRARGGGNNEQQCYVDRPENLRVERGRLVLEARRGAYTGSALVRLD